MRIKSYVPLSLTIFILAGCNQRHYEIVKTGHEGEQMPSVTLISADSSSHFDTRNLKPGSPLVMFYLRPDCPYCQSEVAEILHHLPSLKGTRFCLLASEPSDKLLIFYKNIQRRHVPNFFIGIDYKNDFQNYFSPTAVPFTVVYNSNKTLSKAYLGALTAPQLQKALND